MIQPAQMKTDDKTNKWTRRMTGRKQRRQERRITIDSGATSHFATDKMDLPNMGPSDKLVYLPDDTTLQASAKTMLPFPQLSNKAREADILPGLKRNLASVSKFSDKGLTTVFHPGEGGVTVHKPGTIRIITNEPPVLQGCKSKGLWSVAMDEDEPKREGINSVYSIPSTEGKIKFLHAAAGYPVEETWIKALAGDVAV